MKYTKIGDVKKPTGDRVADAGIDFFVPNDWNNGKPMRLYRGQQVNIPSCIKVKVPQGSMLQMNNKSGIALKRGLIVGASVIDSSYRGICHINLFKVVRGTEDKRDWLGRYYTEIAPGDKIVQGVIVKVSTESLSEMTPAAYEQGPKTKRGAGGFGSTGTK